MPRTMAGSRLHTYRNDPWDTEAYRARGQSNHQAVISSQRAVDAVVASVMERYVFRVEIPTQSEPRIWREVCVPSDFTFHKLHKVLQIAFGWADTRLYQFRVQSNERDENGNHAMYMSLQELDWTQELRGDHQDEYEDVNSVYLSSVNTRMRRVFGKKGMASEGSGMDVVYQYCMSEEWVHQIEFVGVAARDLVGRSQPLGIKEGQHSFCTDGEGRGCKEGDGGPGLWDVVKMSKARRGRDLWYWDVVSINRRLDHMWLTMTENSRRRLRREIEEEDGWKEAVDAGRADSRQRMQTVVDPVLEWTTLSDYSDY